MRSATYAFALVALAVGLSACGSNDDRTAPSTTMADADSMSMDMAMGDAGATPATEVAGGELSTGEFVALPTAPAGSTPHGEAALARHGGGTTVTLYLRGLEPGAAFVAHVHEGACHEAGGPHYKYEPEGSDTPPNEIHLSLTSDDSGMAQVTVENEQVADERARSVVVHAAAGDAPKLACADMGDVQ